MSNKKLPLFWLLAVTYFLQGIEGLPGQSMFIYLKNVLKFSPSQVMYLGVVTSLAWLVKPIWGMLIDSLGTKKLWYGVALIGSLILSLILGLSTPLFIWIVIFLTLSSLFASIRDISSDGLMVCSGKENNNTGQLQAIQWISLTGAGVLVGVGGGWIAEHVSYKVGFLYLIPLYLIAFYILSRSSTGATVNTTVPKPGIKDYLKLLQHKEFLWVCLFLFLYKFSPSFGTPLSYKMRDVFHWSEQFIGNLGAISSCISICGAIVYFKISKKIDIKKWLIFSIIFGGIVTLSYLYYTAFTALLYTIIYSFIDMVLFLLIMDFMAKETIDGLEATSFALLCSISNLAGTASTLTGAYLLPKVGLNTLIWISSITTFLCLFVLPKIKFNKDVV